MSGGAQKFSEHIKGGAYIIDIIKNTMILSNFNKPTIYTYSWNGILNVPFEHARYLIAFYDLFEVKSNIK